MAEINPDHEPLDDYDGQHGKPEDGRDHKDSGLTESSNRGAAEPAEPFRNLRSE